MRFRNCLGNLGGGQYEIWELYGNLMGPLEDRGSFKSKYLGRVIGLSDFY